MIVVDYSSAQLSQDNQLSPVFNKCKDFSSMFIVFTEALEEAGVTDGLTEGLIQQRY